jgi:hypothetical protein
MNLLLPARVNPLHALLTIAGIAILALAPLAAQEKTQEPEPGRRLGDVARFGEDLVIRAGETAKEVVCFRCSVKVEGAVTGDVGVFAGSLEVKGRVTGDVAVFLGDIRLEDGAEVSGDIAVFGGKIDRDPGARVSGEVVAMPNLLGLIVFFAFLGLVITLVLVAITYAAAGQRRIGTIAQVVRERTGVALLIGLAACVGFVALIIIFAMMGPAAPILILVLIAATVVTALVGFTGVSSWMGSSVAKSAGPLAAVMLGAILLTLIQWIPLIGVLAGIVFAFLALGSALLTGFGTHPNWLLERVSGSPAGPPGAGPAPPIGP